MGDNDPVAALLDPAPMATETPSTTEPASTEAPAQVSEVKEPEAPAAKAEPDYDSLLANEEVVNKLLQHEKAQQRIKSVRQADIDRIAQERATEIVRRERERIDAEAKERLRRADDARRDDELWKEIEEDPTSPLAQRLRPELEARRSARQSEAAQEAALEKLIPQVMPSLQKRAMTEAGRYWMGVLDGYVKEADGLTDEQRTQFDPRDEKWTSPLEFVKALSQASAKSLAEAEIKRRLPVEVEAEIVKRNGVKRAEEPAPVVLPPGGKAGSDGEFLSAYASGNSTDHGRALKQLRDLGLQI